MGVNDGPKLIGRLQLRDDRTGRVGRHREHDGVVRPDRDAGLAEIEPGDGVRRHNASAQLVAKAESSPTAFEVRHRRLDESRAEPLRRQIGPARRATSCDRFPHHRPREIGRRRTGVGVEGRQQQGPHHLLVRRPAAGHDLPERLVLRWPHQTRQSDIVARAGVRRAAPTVEHP